MKNQFNSFRIKTKFNNLFDTINLVQILARFLRYPLHLKHRNVNTNFHTSEHKNNKVKVNYYIQWEYGFKTLGFH